MAHTPWEVAIGSTDTFHRRVDPSKRIDRPPQTGSTSCVFGHLNPCIHKDLPNRFFAPECSLQIMHDLRRGGHTIRINGHTPAAQDLGKLEEITRFPSSTRTNISPIKLHLSQLLGQFALPGVRMTRNGRFELRQINAAFVNEVFIPVSFDRLISWCGPVQLAAIINERLSLCIKLEDPVLPTGFDCHVGYRHAIID
jgi:hypothetical protein